MDRVVDNDLILKSVSYGLASVFWPDDGQGLLGILGAARYVVAHELHRASLNRGAEDANSDLSELLARRKASSGVVSRERIRAITRLRVSFERKSVTTGSRQHAQLAPARESRLLRRRHKPVDDPRTP